MIGDVGGVLPGWNRNDSMNNKVDFIDIEDALRRVDSSAEASESHGILCGMLCSAGRAELKVWIEQVMGENELDMSDVLARESLEQLGQLYEDTVGQLNDPEMGFQLLLPEDKENLRYNVQALSEWCEGFLLGFSMGAPHAEDSLPDEVRELLTDFVEITKVETGEESEDEQDLESFVEVIEYVRMGVLLIQELLHPLRGPSTLQ
ncbi:MAG: YecA family protein [Gammaproteobacteria bacterium]|nr:YecA family protein [Gammaproteobacteria bacterium]